MLVPYENLIKIEKFLGHQHRYNYLLGIYAAFAVPLHTQVIEPSAFPLADKVRVELLTAESIFIIVPVINPVAEATDISPNLSSAPSETPRLF